ncbi:Type II secretory pathway component [Idiomarina ramblicola]|uniref:Type II secretory pathway component n=1 Tax=Idiomarina ramblicola TaxID=263724 RepID=A0A432Z245_9GAMM|nr:Type II secretory pathway component [Idiomarina ramblicola]RUO71945.1 Type II secretory pathway component [Idiomarina ramblicola]
MHLKNVQRTPVKKQQGSALVVAIFVIVALGALVAVLSNLVRGTSESVVVEVIGVRSFMAAQSGLERGMNKVYPLSGAPADQCEGFPLNVELINNCQATVTCRGPEEYSLSSNETYTHIRLEAVGSCAAGKQTASRQLAIETRVKKE